MAGEINPIEVSERNDETVTLESETPNDEDDINATVFKLHNRENPEVPGIHLATAPVDTHGLSIFDSLNAWECALSPFTTLNNIPTQFHSKWAHLFDKIMIRIEAANTKIQLERCYKNFLIFPENDMTKGKLKQRN